MFVVTHKPLYIKIPKCYTPIKVGNNSDEKLNKYLKDNIGDNISSKNSSYCELTAIYWIYKNYDLADYVGICHYRRFFVKGLFSRLLNENDILKLMSKYDVILPYKNKAKPNVWRYFVNSKSCASQNDLYKLKDIIKQYYADIFRFCLYMIQNEEDSYDITQETFLKFMKYGTSYQRNNLKGYLLTIARNCCFDYQQRRKEAGKNLRSYEADKTYVIVYIMAVFAGFALMVFLQRKVRQRCYH